MSKSWRSIGGRNTHQLAAGIALHGLSLAIAREVVGTTALVASSSSGVAAISTTVAAVEASTRRSNSTTGTLDSRGSAVALQRYQQLFEGRIEAQHTARWPGWLQL